MPSGSCKTSAPIATPITGTAVDNGAIRSAPYWLIRNVQIPVATAEDIKPKYSTANTTVTASGPHKEDTPAHVACGPSTIKASTSIGIGTATAIHNANANGSRHRTRPARILPHAHAKPLKTQITTPATGAEPPLPAPITTSAATHNSSPTATRIVGRTLNNTALKITVNGAED